MFGLYFRCQLAWNKTAYDPEREKLTVNVSGRFPYKCTVFIITRSPMKNLNMFKYIAEIYSKHGHFKKTGDTREKKYYKAKASQLHV
jgi:hypothetical protein